jgi:hypothetical protein
MRISYSDYEQILFLHVDDASSWSQRKPIIAYSTSLASACPTTFRCFSLAQYFCNNAVIELPQILA